MSMDNYPQARKGVDLLFKSQVAAIVGAILTIIFPLIGIIVTIIALVLELKGLKEAGKDDKGYGKALKYIIISFAIEVVVAILSLIDGVAVNVINIIATGAEDVFSILVALCIINTTTKLLHKNSDKDEEAYGKKVLTIYIIMNVVTFITTILSTVFAENNALAIVFSIATVVASIVYIVMFMMFLNKARKTL